MSNLIPFAVLAIVLITFATAFRNRLPQAAAPGVAPGWSVLDVAIVAAIAVTSGSAYALEHVLSIGGEDPRRILASSMASYLGAILFSAAHFLPSRSRLLHNLHPKAGVAAIVCLALGTAFLWVAQTR